MLGTGRYTEVLKGENPMVTWKREKAARSLKERMRDYCQEYHWDHVQQMSYKIPKDMGGCSDDSYVPFSWRLFFYNALQRAIRIPILFRIRMWWQAAHRPYGLSDNKLWSADTAIAKFSLAALSLYKKLDRMGYPSIFSDYNEDEHRWKDRAEFDEAIANGTHLGGSEKAWEATLDHIIMALEHVALSGDSKEESKWFLKYFGSDPFEETKVNEYVSYDYRPIERKPYIGSVSSSEMPNLDEVEYCVKTTNYMNSELIFYAEDCVAYGLEKFGCFFKNLWD